MSNKPPAPIRSSDYEAIESALLGSLRGRWFLTEYSRRNRTADTQMLLDAITRLETAVMHSQTPSGDERIRRDLMEMSEAIARTRQEIAAIKAPSEDNQIAWETEELGAIAEATKKATSDILAAAEEVQEIAWLLREKGMEEASCDRLDRRATDIYSACSFQDITGQRISKVVDALRYLEARVNAMKDIWSLDGIEIRDDPVPDACGDAQSLNGPQPESRALRQEDVDQMIGLDPDDLTVIERTEQEPASASPEHYPSAPPAAESSHVEPTGEGVVRAEGFTRPRDLTVAQLDPAKTKALFS